MIKNFEFLDKILDEISELKKSHDLLEQIYTQVGPYRNGDITEHTWGKVKNHFGFDDSEYRAKGEGMNVVKVHKVELLIVDDDNVGREEIESILENTNYPNHCIYPRVMDITTKIVDWTDNHPLNKSDTMRDAYHSLFDN